MVCAGIGCERLRVHQRQALQSRLGLRSRAGFLCDLERENLGKGVWGRALIEWDPKRSAWASGDLVGRGAWQ